MQSINRKDALAALKTLASVVGGKARDAEATKLVYIGIWPDSVSLTAHSADLAQRLTLHLNTTPAVADTWEAAVDLKVLANFVKDSHSQVVTLQYDAQVGQLIVDAICLNSYPYVNWPAGIGVPLTEPCLTLDAANLRKGLTMTQWTASTDTETRPSLNGIYVKTTEDYKATFAAADGFRLAVYDVPAVGDFDAILPLAAVNVLLRALPESGPVSVSTWTHTETRTVYDEVYHSRWNRSACPRTSREVTEDLPYARFDWGSGRLDTRLVEGKFPDYAQIIPKVTGAALTLAPHALTVIKQLAATYGKGESNILQITPTTCGIVLCFKTESGGADMAGTMTCPVPLGLDVRYLYDILTIAGADQEHVLHYAKPNDADKQVYGCLLLQEGDLTICQMPMHLGGAVWAK